jgi:hypothetical protein
MRTNAPECHPTVEVSGAFNGVEELSAVPMLFTSAHDEYSLAPIAGRIVVRGAKPSDVLMIESWPLTGVPESVILRLSRFSAGSPPKKTGLPQGQERFGRQ